MNKLLIPIDLSDTAENAIDFALDVFATFKPELMLMHVKQPDEDLDLLKAAFGQLEDLKLSKAGFDYNFEITRGNLLDDIQSAIDTEKPDLLVMGTNGIKGSELSKALVKLTNCPLMLIPENYHWSKIKRIAYANDFQSIKDSAVLLPLMALAQRTQAKVYLLHINRDNHVTDNAEASLEYYLHNVNHEYVCITNANIENAITDFIKEKDIDMLTVLLRDHGKNELSSEGRLVKELVVHANVPVLNLV